MYRLSLAAVVLLACTLPTANAEKLLVPTSPPPQYVVAQVKGDNLQINRTVRKFVPSTRIRVVEKNGERKEVKYTAYVPVFRTIILRRPLKSLGLYNGRGEKLDVEDIKDGLKKPTVVLISADGKKVDPFYLKIVKSETFVIVDKTRVRRGPGVSPGPKPIPVPKRKPK